MAIASAVQRGSVVYVYDEKGSTLAAIQTGSGPDDGLKGYTSKTVSVQQGFVLYTYNERGSTLTAVPVG